MTMKPVRIIAATQKQEMDFFRHTLLGQSIRRLSFDKNITKSITYENTGDRVQGLGKIYNQFLNTDHSHEILLFVHDDVYLDDYHLSTRLNEACSQYDIIGVAGNTAPITGEISWIMQYNPLHDRFEWQNPSTFSGAVSHMGPAGEPVTLFGPSPQPCQLLDGCFLAVNTEKLLATNAQFDEQFRFHFYDLDFCRTAKTAGLNLGTWPIAITHASGGNFRSQEWKSASVLYAEKWHQ